jgi:hypothetical protein
LRNLLDPDLEKSRRAVEPLTAQVCTEETRPSYITGP